MHFLPGNVFRGNVHSGKVTFRETTVNRPKLLQAMYVIFRSLMDLVGLGRLING